MKETVGATVTVVSMGPPQAEKALREAVGREAVRLLVSVDEADYEAGRRRLLLMEEEGGRRSPEAS